MFGLRIPVLRIVTLLAISSVVVGAAIPSYASGAQRGSTSGLIRFRLSYLDRGADDPNAVDLARSGPQGAPLLLFLAGTRSVPSHYTAFLDTAAPSGYSVLGLDYVNRGRSLARTCGRLPYCYGGFEQNRLDGSHVSRFSHVDVENSILRRLAAALDHLDRVDPAGRWSRFGRDSAIHWSRIVVAGHSQGGGEAAYISHRFAVKGVLMFASPAETFDGVSAEWMASRGRTPPARMYALASPDEMYFSRIAPSWTKLGVGTADVACAAPRPTGGHILLTSLALGTPQQSHGRVVDDATPRNEDGVPDLMPTWRWMLAQLRR